MSVIVSSFMPFPCISWWAEVIQCETIVLDRAERYEKMSCRNKYYTTGPNGMICLSIPLLHGREQRRPMNQVQISEQSNWQTKHIRTLRSAYGRSPYFEYYEQSLCHLFEAEYRLLIDFNLASIKWAMKNLRISFEIEFADTYIKTYENAVDKRNMKQSREQYKLPEYYQLFKERNGFLQNLSVLDLLFSEGPGSSALLVKRGS